MIKCKKKVVEGDHQYCMLHEYCKEHKGYHRK